MSVARAGRCVIGVAALLLAASAARAETWFWQDATGADHYTDDPSMVPEDRRHTLRRLGESDDEGWYAGVSVDDREESPEERRAAQARLAQRQAILRTIERIEAEMEPLERARLEAENERRRYATGGRIGAADRAAAAKAKVEALDRELAGLRAELQEAQARLALLDG